MLEIRKVTILIVLIITLLVGGAAFSHTLGIDKAELVELSGDYVCKI